MFVAGVLFTLLTVARVRQWMTEAVPPGLRFSFAAGIGLFLAFIGLNEAGIVTLQLRAHRSILARSTRLESWLRFSASSRSQYLRCARRPARS